MKFKHLFVSSFLAISSTAFASVDALFHPKGATLETIASWIESASERVDIAMYNMETTNKSAIVKMLQTPAVKKRLESRDLKIRLLFEGYGTPEENEKNMQNLEALGIDVRTLGSDKKVHHKFAVIDAGSSRVKLITGSANWSLNSRSNYHENILFIDDEPSITNQFESEFELLWKNSQEFGNDLLIESIKLSKTKLDQDLKAHFNSVNYKITPERVTVKAGALPALTTFIVHNIDSATKNILVATTRIKIEAIAEALKRAKERGVDVKIVVSMDEYRCSPGKSFSRELSKSLDVRVKIYNLNPCEYLKNQMHNKYMIVDNERLFTGSFNWSNSSELNHIENIVEIDSISHSDVVNKYIENFNSIWNLNRADWSADEVIAGTDCDFVPTSLSFKEIDQLYKKLNGSRCQKR